MNNLHRITGSAFKRYKPLLCSKCVLRRDYGEWYGYCEADGKVLSNPKEGVDYKRQRCDSFRESEGE